MKIPYLIPESREACRLFHGRGHCFPGLEHVNIDWFYPVILITLYQPVENETLRELVSSLQQSIPELVSIAVQRRFLPQAPLELLEGVLPDPHYAEEDGLKYRLLLGQQQNSGIFLDMANGRRWVREHANQRRVLNLFAYTCGFSVAAVAGGAEKVVNIDMSRRALSVGRDNHRASGLSSAGVVFEGLDIFRSFGRLRKHGPYDLVICDPPTFQKGSVDIRKDYPRLLRRLPEMLAPGAELLLCLNSPGLGAEQLQQWVADACPDWRAVGQIENPPVFREATSTAGLKVLHYRTD